MMMWGIEMTTEEPMTEHPSFTRAKALSEPLRSHFPKSQEEAQNWTPQIRHRALSRNVLVAARTRIECAWVAYVDAVPRRDHDFECGNVLKHGAKLPEKVARALFPQFDEVPYAE